MAKIPSFKSLEEAGDFWDTHDFEDYVDDTEAVVITVQSPPRQQTLQVALDAPTFKKITDLAAKRRMRPEKLVSAWLREMAASEATRK